MKKRKPTDPPLAFDMKKACDTCPFRKDVPLDGSPEWLMDVIKGLKRKNLQHTCHKSDPEADGYVGGPRKQHCVGFLGLMKNEGLCISPAAAFATARGQVDWDKVPTDNIYLSFKDFVLAYAVFYEAQKK